MALTPTLLLGGLERTLNALLARDPAAPSRLARLAGQRILLRLEHPPLALVVAFHPQGLDLLRPDDEPEEAFDAIVELDAETLGELLGGAPVERLMFQGKLAVRGRIPLLEAARDLLLDLDLDWEGELARWLGDLPAHSLAEGMRSLGRWGLRTRQELCADVAEYVFEEARLLPGRHQLEGLRDHLTELEVATDRLEARLERLRRRLTQRGGGA
ncbi:SCP2 domain-containing protein [Halomonas beimenensis]|uniref:Ubiquinone biosynthesis accessory factor UbiJ n=1 Tax=Halomonas beimenensis TaxID=475662 RepID=A0A291PB85_9GAMM|nr:SCP2 sterol-binding domain-containing protein [Halomonas beimenensis]ATJ84167.1 ubiquinone biosynthesis protein UbiJ, contains SCP2 domain [Halomonas beimenensis]